MIVINENGDRAGGADSRSIVGSCEGIDGFISGR